MLSKKIEMNESLEVAGGLFIYKYLVGDIAIFPSEKSKEKLLKAQSLLNMGETKKALEQVNISMEIDTPKGIHFFLKGCILHALEDYEGAIENLENSLKLAEDFDSVHIVGTPAEIDLKTKVDIYLYLGMSRFHLEDFDNAIKIFDEGLQILNYILKRFWRKFWGKTKEETIELKNYYLLYRGLSNYHLAIYEETIKDLNNLRNVEFNIDRKININSILGSSKLNLEDYQGAINDLNVAINLDPHDTNILYNRGFSKFNLEDYEGAIKDFDEVLLKEPSNKDALVFRDYIKSGLESVRKNSEILNYGPLTLLPEKCEAIWFESSINLDHREFLVLHCLLRFQGQIISPSWIINESFPFDKKDNTREIEIYIEKLRKKLEPDPVNPIYLRSVFNYEDFIEEYILELPTGSQNNLRKEFIDNFL